MLELAVLGLLHEAPMHGYELRKRLQEIRAFSCGTVYPTLRRMRRAGLIEETQEAQQGQEAQRSRRARRVYRLTESGRERFVELVEDCGPRACQDEAFDVRLAFFARTPAPVRMRILESRRRRVEQRREGQRAILARADEQCDRYTAQLHRLGLDHSELEVRWLDELIAHERAEQGAERPAGVGDRLDRGLDRDTTNGT
ncbi:DNA-binding transcriptional regulator, PadR family [Actinopolyspora lacussalsi subsp. righensis]|uniref:DNA-binding transcriptional regulator, PadR family n=1 Tax=Actinopolyspora righensis TaxID=995060 RepID=A0A1I6ZHI3_9ACTN|nr:PadR family transcriptional regulator [Actinopolyspora righensis]SFT62132.1 DNA-binding transcriptional regulator, PadR family [Actinopolyspora righensis]